MIGDSGASKHAVTNLNLFESLTRVKGVTVELTFGAKTTCKHTRMVSVDLEKPRRILRCSFYTTALKLNNLSSFGLNEHGCSSLVG